MSYKLINLYVVGDRIKIFKIILVGDRIKINLKKT
jgi:hypothetical protein